jgi:hypothetical protein
MRYFRACELKGVTNIWFSNSSKERTNKRTEIGRKITNVNTLYKHKVKSTEAVILLRSCADHGARFERRRAETYSVWAANPQTVSSVPVVTLHHILFR